MRFRHHLPFAGRSSEILVSTFRAGELYYVDLIDPDENDGDDSAGFFWEGDGNDPFSDHRIHRPIGRRTGRTMCLSMVVTPIRREEAPPDKKTARSLGAVAPKLGASLFAVSASCSFSWIGFARYLRATKSATLCVILVKGAGLDKSPDLLVQLPNLGIQGIGAQVFAQSLSPPFGRVSILQKSRYPHGSPLGTVVGPRYFFLLFLILFLALLFGAALGDLLGD